MWDFVGKEIVRVMPVTRNDLIRAWHNSWLKITIYLQNMSNSITRRVRVVIVGLNYPTRYWLTSFSEKGQYLNMSPFSAANHRDEITFLFFEVKQRLIWHFPGVVIFCQGSVHADLVLEDPSAEWKMEWLCNALQYSSSRGTKNASIIDSRPRTACDVNILLTYIDCFMCIVNFCLEWAITALNNEIFIYIIKKQFQR